MKCHHALTIALILSAAPCPVHAQVITHFGLTAGATHSQISYTFYATTYHLDGPGYSVGVFTELAPFPTRHLTLLVAGSYLHHSVDPPYVRPGSTVDVSYLSVPLLAKITLLPNSATPYLVMGPLLQLETSGISPLGYGDPLYLGAAVGLGTEFSLGRRALSADVRYHQVRASTDDGLPSPLSGTIRHEGWTVAAAFGF